MEIENIKLKSGLTIRQTLEKDLKDMLLPETNTEELKASIKNYLQDAGYLIEE